MTKTSDNKTNVFILEEIKKQLHKTLPDNGHAILYGSQARGDFHEGSDWDVLILIDKPAVAIAENSKITYPLVMLGWDLGVEINPVLYTAKEWDSYAGTPFYDNVMKDGLSLA